MPALRANDDTAISIALDKIHDELAQQFSDDQVEDMAKAMSERVNNNHSRKFFAAVAVATGTTIIGSDSPKRGAGLAGAGVGGGMPPTPGPPGFVAPGGPRKAKLGVRVSVAPELFADEFVASNVELIGELRAGIKEGLGDAIVRAKQFGGDPEETATRLLEVWKKNGVPSQLPTTRLKKSGEPVMLSTEKHARLVAHDQINKLNADLNQTRQRAAGVTKYVWTTQGDSRVRPAHRALNGQVFDWQNPPAVGPPGTPINCRCFAVPVVDKDQILESGDFIEL